MSIFNTILDSHLIQGGSKWGLLTQKHLENEKCLEAYGYKVYSQNDEDGIIQEIFQRIGTTNKVFVEFGVQDGLESNCHYLLFNDWTGLWLEGDERYVESIRSKFHPVLESEQLKCKCAFITRDNINDLILESGISGEIDLLSIDVDGNDYHIWESIWVIKPRVVIIEYNGKFPPDCNWIMAYNDNHVWDGSDWHGASLKSFELLGKKLGYQLVGTNLTGANAFFVREDLTKNLFYTPATAEALYNPLRLDIVHKNGHPARYCLKNQKEALGMLNYLPDEIATAGFGFHNPEHENKRTFRWMSDLQCSILVRSSKIPITLKIPYFIAPEAFIGYENNYFITADTGITPVQTISLAQPNGVFKIVIPPLADRQAVSKVTISVPFLWKPSEILKSTDERSLGLALVFSEICILTKD